MFTAYLRRAEESALGGLLVEITILRTAMRQNATQVLRDAATAYQVDVDAIGLKVKQEFAAKEKARLSKEPPTRKRAIQTNEESKGRIASAHLLRESATRWAPFSCARPPTLAVAPAWQEPYARPSDGLVRTENLVIRNNRDTGEREMVAMRWQCGWPTLQ